MGARMRFEKLQGDSILYRICRSVVVGFCQENIILGKFGCSHHIFLVPTWHPVFFTFWTEQWKKLSYRKSHFEGFGVAD